MPTSKDIEGWIEAVQEEIDARREKFTPWELTFISSISEQFDRTGYLTQAQVETLERVYANKTS